MCNTKENQYGFTATFLFLDDLLLYAKAVTRVYKFKICRSGLEKLRVVVETGILNKVKIKKNFISASRKWVLLI